MEERAEEEKLDDARASLADAPGDRLRLRDALRLEGKGATACYWGSLAVLAVAIFVPRLLPCTDYPQHLGLADIGRRLFDPAAPEHASFQLNLFTYNGLFHLLVAQLSRVLSIELAGRVVLASSLVLLGGASLALLRALGRPAGYAALMVPVIFSSSVGWGFVNYALGVALMTCALVFVARALRRPSIACAIGAALLSLLCAATHVLATLLLCLFAASLAPELALRATAARGQTLLQNATRAAVRATIALCPLLVGAAFCIAVYRVQYAWSPGSYSDPTLEGSAPSLGKKLLHFCAWATGLHADHSDQLFVLAALVVVLVAWIASFRRGHGETTRRDASVVLPFVVVTAAYLMTPMVIIGTHVIFPRLAQAVVLAAVVSAPRITGARARLAEIACLGLALFSSLNLLVHVALYARETDDASRVIDDLPAGRRATAVVYQPETFAFRGRTLVHLAAYYGARKHADWAYSFARFLSVPVRYTATGAPGWPARGWEFGPQDYDARCRYARTFDLVIVAAPPEVAEDASGEPAIRARVFGDDRDAVRLLSHHGRFWAFDSAGLPADGTP